MLELDKKLLDQFQGYVVRKDVVRSVKGGANVPVFVLEYLLANSCSTDDEQKIKEGVENVKNVLRKHYVNPDEANLIQAKIREEGTYKVIDKISVRLDASKDKYWAELSNLNIRDANIDDRIVTEHEKMMMGGIWAIVDITYDSTMAIGSKLYPFVVSKVRPIQLSSFDMSRISNNRKNFTNEEWLNVLLRSGGYEPESEGMTQRMKMLLLSRFIPMVEANFNMAELGPRSSGKSYVFKELSPYSMLVSGGQGTAASLFVNNSNGQIGAMGKWDAVCFDESTDELFKDREVVPLMKDYMESGSFSRAGKSGEKSANASIILNGNINQPVETVLQTSHLFSPFSDKISDDTAFLDRMHCYLPGWEIPKFRPEHFTDDYGFISDYLAEFIRELRKEQYGDALDHNFRLGRNLNQRDTIAVRRMVDGYLKLMYPNGEFTKEELEEVIQIALEMRRRVKEQLKKLGGMEFYDVNFSYIDLEDMSEHYVSVPEQGGGKLIPDGMCNPGQVYTVSRGKSGMIGVFRLESQMLPGNGKIERTGLGSDSKCKEAVNTAFNYLKANGNRISGSISTSTKDYIINYQDLQGIGMTEKLALPTLVALCSIALGKPVVSNLAILGDITISGTMIKVDELANTLQVCLDSGAKKVLIPSTSFVDFASVPADLMSAFQLIPYQSAEDAVFKALGVE